MSLPQLYKYYKLTPQKLKEILQASDIDADLRYIKEIPESWHDIISLRTGLPKIDLDSFTIPKGNKSNNVKIVDTSLESLKKVKQDLKPFTHAPKQHIAYVKFVAADKSHAFVRVLENLEGIYKENFRDKTEKDYRIIKDCDQLEFNQIIICRENKKDRSMELVSTGFTAYFTIKNLRNRFQNFKNTFYSKYYLTLAEEHLGPETIEIKKQEGHSDLKLHRFRIFFERRSFTVQVAESNIIAPKFIEKCINEVKAFLGQTTLEEAEKDKVTFLKENTDAQIYNELTKKQFDIDRTHDACFSDEDSVSAFITKWGFLQPEYLAFSNLNHKQATMFFYEKWMEKKLHADFWGASLIETTIEYLCHYDGNKQELYTKRVIAKYNAFFHEKLRQYLEGDFEINSLQQTRALKNIIKAILPLDNPGLQDLLYIKATDALKLELWQEDETKKFPKDAAIARFSELDVALQVKIIKELEEDEILPLLDFLKTHDDYDCTLKIGRAAYVLIEEIFQTVCLDLETDTQTIQEMAWIEKRQTVFFQGNNSAEGIKRLKAMAISGANTIVGQNIIHFDCAELEKYGVIFEHDRLWDTFMIEMILSPEMKNFALKTKHSAADDAGLTLELFYNQILRIILLTEQELTVLYGYIPEHLIQKVNKFKSKVNGNWISTRVLNEQKLAFFRPQPIPNSILSEIGGQIIEKSPRHNLIIVPESLKKSLYPLKNITFYSPEKSKDYGFLDIHKIQGLSSELRWIKSCLSSLYNYYTENGQIPYWGSVAAAVKMRAEEEIDLYSILSFKEYDRLAANHSLVVTGTEFYAISDDLAQHDVQVYLINKELLLGENKTCLGTLDISELIGTASKKHFWIKFAGGTSYIGIDKKDCLDLNIAVPDAFENFWIEKQDFKCFKVWGNYNIESLIGEISSSQPYCIDTGSGHVKSYFPKLRIDANADKEFISFNPETNYRSRYWLFQKEVLLQIYQPHTPTLLVIQNEQEVEGLENYFRASDFYVPSRKATTARRLELLHQKRYPKKIVVIPLKEFHRSIASNYVDKLNVVIEGLKLFEAYFIVKGISSLDGYAQGHSADTGAVIYQPEGDTEDETEHNPETAIKTPLFKDLFFHLSLQAPFLRNVQAILMENFKDNTLWILDPRAGDYDGISELWDAAARTLTLGRALNFEKELQLVDQFISGPKPLKELPFSLEKTKSILSDLFLDGQPWYKEQEPYLDDIIPALMDRLITLPTGGGKSLLFQGPAILRSAFTNKLTIVVTPLKALMQDQVEALWEKGFYGCVDYLNSDRGTDTQVVYRGMAGGEISLLFITPERFRSKGFKNALNIRLKMDGGLEYAVFDEAHCVSQWGHEFRPDYFNSAREIASLKKIANQEFPLLLFSATVSKKIYEDFNTIFS